MGKVTPPKRRKIAVMTVAAYEKTPQDRADDKREAKAAKMPLRRYENSRQDRQRDAAAVKKMNASARRGQAAKNTPVRNLLGM